MNPIIGDVMMSEREIARLSSSIPGGGIYLEVGTAAGRSAAVLADLRPDIAMLCVDVCCDSAEHSVPRVCMWLHNRRSNMNLWVGTLMELLAWMPDPWFDVVLIDADHRYEGCLSDLREGCKLTNHLFAHDHGNPGWPGVSKALSSFLQENSEWKMVDTVDMLAVLGKVK